MEEINAFIKSPISRKAVWSPLAKNMLIINIIKLKNGSSKILIVFLYKLLLFKNLFLILKLNLCSKIKRIIATGRKYISITVKKAANGQKA